MQGCNNLIYVSLFPLEFIDNEPKDSHYLIYFIKSHLSGLIFNNAQSLHDPNRQCNTIVICSILCNTDVIQYNIKGTTSWELDQLGWIMKQRMY
jgi:hypothetical protein